MANNEAEFEHEATKMFFDMGLQDVDRLNFFQSPTDRNEKWKEGLRKPSQPRVRRFRTGDTAVLTHRPPTKESVVGKQAPFSNETCQKPDFQSKLHTPVNYTKPVKEDAYGYRRVKGHERAARAQSVPERVPDKFSSSEKSSRRGSSVSPHPPNATHYPAKALSSQATLNKPTTVVKVKSTHIPLPAVRPVPVPFQRLTVEANNQKPAVSSGGVNPVSKPADISLGKAGIVANDPKSDVTSNGEETKTADTLARTQPSTTATKVLYSREPRLKLLSVKTSTSTTVQCVADNSLPRHLNADTSDKHLAMMSPNARQDKSTSSGIPPFKQPSSFNIPHAYDRLEGYREMILSSSEQVVHKSSNHSSVHTTSPTRASSVNSDMSQGSNASLKSTGSSSLSEKRHYSQNSIPISRRLSAPSSSSGSHTSIPTAGVIHRQTSSNTSGDLYSHTKDDSSLESLKLSTSNNKETNKSGHDTKASEINSIPALETVMEVDMPTTLTENFKIKVAVPKTKQNSSSRAEKVVHILEESEVPILHSVSQVDLSERENELVDGSCVVNDSVNKTSSVSPPSAQKHTTLKESSKQVTPDLKIPDYISTEDGSKLLLHNVSFSRKTLNGERHESTEECAGGKESLEEEEDFFGYCYQCGMAVVGEETGCLALGKVFHTKCLNCSKCGKVLSGKTFYTIDQNIFCKIDYLNSLQRCCFCNQRVKNKVLTAFGEVYHPGCFRCAECGVYLDGVPYAGQSHDKVYCIKDYHRLFAPPCMSCGEPIVPQPGKAKNIRVKVKDRYYHVRCYKCEECGKLFASTKQQSIMVDGCLFCQKCHKKHLEGSVRTTIL